MKENILMISFLFCSFSVYFVVSMVSRVTPSYKVGKCKRDSQVVASLSIFFFAVVVVGELIPYAYVDKSCPATSFVVLIVHSFRSSCMLRHFDRKKKVGCAKGRGKQTGSFEPL